MPSVGNIIGQASRGADLYFVFRFLRLLTMKYTSTDAYKLGIIEKKGKALKKSADLESIKEKAAYTMLHRMVFKIRGLIEKVPLVGKSILLNYAAALFLLKEQKDTRIWTDDGYMKRKLMEFLETDWEADAKFLKEEVDNMEKKSFTSFLSEGKDLTESQELQAMMALDDAGIEAVINKKGKIVVNKKDLKKAEKALKKSFRKGGAPELVGEEVELDEEFKEKDFDALKKGDTITIEFKSSMSTGKSTFKVTAKNVVGKARVEKATLQNVKKPNSVKFYLYKRGNKVSLAQGDMAASVVKYTVEQLEERKMTDGEKEEREEIVKKLKPKLQSFKDRYGADAEKVMYATATKQAMEEVELDEIASTMYGIVKGTQEKGKVVFKGSKRTALKKLRANEFGPNTILINAPSAKVGDKWGKGKTEEVEEAVLADRDYKYDGKVVKISKKNFSKVHKDFKNSTKGKERMLINDPKTGGSISVPVQFEEMGNVAPTAPDSGGIQYQAPVLGQKKKTRTQKIDEEVQRTTFAGKDVFIVDSETFYNCRMGKRKYGRYEKYVGDRKVGQTIREYGLKYPRRPIILQNGESGPMLYLKYGRS